MVKNSKITGLFFLFLFAFGIGLMAQDQVSQQQELPTTEPKTGYSPTDIPVNVRFETGFSMGNNWNGDAAFSHFINPSLRFQASKRLNIQTSFGYTQAFNQSFLLYNKEQNQFEASQQNIAIGTIAVSGDYLVNPKLILSGTVWKQFDLQPQTDQINPRALNFEAEGIVVGMQYNISDKMQFNASFGYTRGSTPYQTGYNSVWGRPSPFMPSFGAQPNHFFNW